MSKYARLPGLYVGKTVLRIAWSSGRPYVQFGKVTSVTPQTFHVDGKRPLWGDWWETSIEDAIDDEYQRIFIGRNNALNYIFGSPDRPDTQITLRAIFRLRRLERRLSPRFRKKQK